MLLNVHSFHQRSLLRGLILHLFCLIFFQKTLKIRINAMYAIVNNKPAAVNIMMPLLALTLYVSK